MTSAEFQAWFQGFSEGIEAAPTKKQWERIKEKVAEIHMDNIYPYYPVYTPSYPSIYPNWPTYIGPTCLTGGTHMDLN